MVRDVRFDIKADDRTRAAFQSAQRNLATTNRQYAGLRGEIEKTTRQASSMAAVFGRGLVAGSAVGGLLSLTGALSKARTAVTELDKVAKTARATGLGSDFYQSLILGANEATVSTQELNAALGGFAKRSAEASIGKGEMVEKLKVLNPELLKSIQGAKDNETRLRLVAEAMREAKTETERAAIAYATLGESSARLIPVFAGGSQALDDFSRRARDMGLIIDQELLAKAEVLETKLGVLSQVIDTNLNVALVELAPLLVKAAEEMATFAQEVRQLGDDPLEFLFGPTVADYLRTFGEATNVATGEMAELHAEIATVKARIEEAKRVMETGFMPDEVIAEDVARLKVLEAQLDNLAVKRASTFAERHRSAEALSMQALAEYNAGGLAPPAGGGGGGGGSTVSRTPAIDTKPLDLIRDTAGAVRDVETAYDAATKKAADFANTATSALTNVIVGGQKASDTALQLALSFGEAALEALILQAITAAMGFFGGGGGGGSAVGGMGTSFHGTGSLYARGGSVSGPGTGSSDSILARLSDGEFVVNAKAAKQNRRLLEMISSGLDSLVPLPTFAQGGFVPGGESDREFVIRRVPA